MKPSMSHVFSQVISLLLLTCIVRAQASETATKFRTVRDHLIIVPVLIQNELFEFLVDTGTNTSIITPETAARLNLHAVDRLEMITANGSVVIPRAFLTRLQLGGKTVERLEVLLSDLSELRCLDKRVSGILGQNFLSEFKYLVDYRNERLEFFDTIPAQFRGQRLPLERDEGRLIVTTTGNDKSRSLRLILDSAASDLIFFGSKQELQLESETASGSELITNTGTNTTHTGVLRQLKLANESLAHIPVAFLANQFTESRQSVDGLLPSRLFRTIYFNNHEGYVLLNPK